MAIGIISFALLAVVALLPVGLKSVKSANEQAAAARLVTSISDSLLQARTTNGSTYSFNFAGSSSSYTLGGPATNASWTNLSIEGAEVTGQQFPRLVAVLDIVPPTTNASGLPMGAGHATISIAWPTSANPSWSSANKTWSKAEGSMTTAIQFFPPQ